MIVNRLWQHHFGRGIVATPSDFGIQGERPTHPELLDWLAAELIRERLAAQADPQADHDQRRLHAGRPTSTRRSAADRPATTRCSGGRPPRRLEAEAIRDAMLAVSGTLDPTMFGPGTLDEAHAAAEHLLHHQAQPAHPDADALRRPRRARRASASGRTTTIAPQALLLMNNPQVRGYAEAFAGRAPAEAGRRPPRRSTAAYRIALGRDRRRRRAGRRAWRSSTAAGRLVPGRRAGRRPRAGPGRLLPGPDGPERVHLHRLTELRIAAGDRTSTRTPCHDADRPLRLAASGVRRRREFLRAPARASACSRWPACSSGRPARPARGRGRRALNPLAPQPPHFPAKAKSVIWLFMNGGPSQVDTWDYKPELEKRDGQELKGFDKNTGFFTDQVGPLMKSPFKFAQHGQCGDVGLGDLPEPGQARRRHGVHPLVLHRLEQPLAGPVQDQHRHDPDGLPVRRLVGHLRPGHREPEPARLRRHVRHARPRPAQGARAELGRGLPAGRLPGHGAQAAGRADRQPRSPPRP